MRHGFIKTAAGTPKIQVADCVYNAGEILKLIRQMETEGAKIMAFPELCITGYTCQDLFWQTLLLDSAREQLIWLAKETSQVDALIIVVLGGLGSITGTVIAAIILGLLYMFLQDFGAIRMIIYSLVSFFCGWTVSGWSSLLCSIWAIGGLQLLAIGVIGEYIGKIYMETKRRPRFIVDKVLDDNE